MTSPGATRNTVSSSTTTPGWSAHANYLTLRFVNPFQEVGMQYHTICQGSALSRMPPLIYIYSSSVITFKVEVPVLHLTSILCNLVWKCTQHLTGKYCIFTPLHQSVSSVNSLLTIKNPPVWAGKCIIIKMKTSCFFRVERIKKFEFWSLQVRRSMALTVRQHCKLTLTL